MARYWVLGTGNWSDTAHWSASSGGAGGETVPSSSDNVIFDGLSHTGAYTVTIDATANCADMTWGYPATDLPTLAGSSTLNVYGSLSILAGMGWTWTGYLNFKSTATEKTITCNGIALNSTTTFNGIGGGWTLQDAFNIGTSKTLYLTNGVLDTNGVTVTASIFSSSNSNTRSLTLGASTINLGGSTPWAFATTTNLTFNAGTSTINLSSTAGNFEGGGLTYATVTMIRGQINGANTYTNLTINGNADVTAEMSIYADQTITSTFTATGNSLKNRLFIYSDTIGTVRTITADIVSLTNVDFRDITGAGVAAPFTGTSLGNCGGLTSITTTTPVTRYWVGNGGNWSSTGEWSATSGGASGASIPLVQDTAVFDANSFSSGGQTITIDMARIPTFDFSGGDSTPNLTVSVACECYGSIDLTGINTFTATAGAFSFAGRSTHAIRSNGKTFGNNLSIIAFGGSYTLSDVLTGTSSYLFRVYDGTFDANDQNVNFGKFWSSVTSTRVVTMGNGTWTMNGTGTVWTTDTTTGLTLNAEGSTIKITDTSATGISFYGGGLTYNNIWFAGGTTTKTYTLYSANIFNDFKDDGTAAHIIVFPNVATTVTTFTVSGNVGALISLTRTGGSGTWTLSAATGTIVRDYLSISNSTASGGATFYAGANSTNGGGNSGWIFTGPPSGDSSMQQYQYYYS